MSRSRKRRKRPRRGLLARAEMILWIVAVCLLGWVAWVQIESHVYEARADQELEAARERFAAATGEAESSDRPPGTASASPSEPSLDLRAGDPIGRIEIPRLELSVVAAEGAGNDVLRRAVGHLPWTSYPGRGGNAAFAGHRDRHFRDLRNVATGDEILVTTPEGTVRYQVEWTKVVGPDEVEVTDPTDSPTLTLITCHPFDFIGPAPNRFIVRARQVDTDAAIGRPAA